MIQVENIFKRYNNKVQALSDVSFSVDKASVDGFDVVRQMKEIRRRFYIVAVRNVALPKI